jgi:hypothetical protein
MNQELVVRRTFHINRERRGRKKVHAGLVEVPAANVPRIARLMALALRFDGLISNGTISNQAELARLGHVSRARLTQIMNLVLLAPDIQETLLFLPDKTNSAAGLHLRQLQSIAQVSNWATQRRLWAALGVGAPDALQ